MRLTWLCQGGYLIEADAARLVFDLYQNDLVAGEGCRRLVQPPLTLQQLRPDVLVASHDHIDHLDPVAAPQIAGLYPQCRFVGPDSVADDLLALGVPQERISRLNAPDGCRLGPFDLRATAAFHSDPRAIGLILAAQGRRIYLSGDSLYRDELAPAVAEAAGGRLDLAVVCINGKLGNMTSQEAVSLVRQLRPAAAIPTHYGLFAANTADPAPFVEACRREGIASRALEPGEPVELDELVGN